MFETIRRRSPDNGRKSRGIPADQGNPPGADAAPPRRSGGASAFAHSLKGDTMRAIAACLFAAAMSGPGMAQTEGLPSGSYVIAQHPCSSYPPLASLYFDGKTFGYKTVKCSLKKNPGTAADDYTAVCMEKNEDSREEIPWKFKKTSKRSFSIDGKIFRLCP